MPFQTVTFPSNIIILANKDILMRDHYFLAKELAIVTGYNSDTDTFNVQSLDGKRTSTDMKLNIDFKLQQPGDYQP